MGYFKQEIIAQIKFYNAPIITQTQAHYSCHMEKIYNVTKKSPFDFSLLVTVSARVVGEGYLYKFASSFRFINRNVRRNCHFGRLEGIEHFITSVGR
jgi:hypothetical protein